MDEAIQFCVGLEHKPGMLAKLCGDLGGAGVNVSAIFVSNDQDSAWVNLVCAPPADAERALVEAGYRFFTEKVLTIEGEDRKGELERVAKRLADAGINITYVYGSGIGGGKFTLVINVDDFDEAAKALAAC